MKKLFNLIGVSVFFIFGLFSLSFSEDVTITTYYPSPYGSYRELTSSTNAYFAYEQPVNRVGIGTTNPLAKLDVRGNSSFVGDAVVSGNTTITGNTGIGTTTPTAKLDVRGNSLFVGDSTVNGNSTINGSTAIGGNTTIGGSTAIGGNTTITGSAAIGGNTTVSGNILTSGNATTTGSSAIGGNTTVSGSIGIGTASPVAKLDVRGGSNLAGNTTVTGNATINGNTVINGNVTVTGSISGGGLKTAIVPTFTGGRKLYVLEAADCRFEDFGRAQLVNGKVKVKLDSLFLETVTITGKYPLIVSITLTSDSPGVFVEKKAAGYFIVKEVQGGKGNATFDYRVTAMRKGFENIRMELASNEQNSHL